MSKPKGLYANIAAKKKRIKGGSGETMRKKGADGAPALNAFAEIKQKTKKMRYGGAVNKKKK
tara:strand:- start:356 stop:541 length:186 start_codon:yes stop_codon:yes gene_type:complete